MRSSAVFAAVLWFATSAHAATSPTKPAEPHKKAGRMVPALRVAVYDLELQGVTPGVGVVVTDSLLNEVRKLQGVSAIGMNEIRDMLSFEATKQMAGCSETAESCLADLAGALGVDELVTGKLSKIDKNSSAMVLRRIDQKRAAVKNTYNERFKGGSGQEYLAAVGPAVDQLFPGFGLRSGSVRGVSKEVALKLDPPPIPKWATITVGIVAVAAAAVGVTFGVLAKGDESTWNNMINGSVNGTAVSGPELKVFENRAQQRALITNVAFGSAGGLALTTGIMALFTDWQGYRNSLNARTSTSVK